MKSTLLTLLSLSAYAGVHAAELAERCAALTAEAQGACFAEYGLVRRDGAVDDMGAANLDAAKYFISTVLVTNTFTVTSCAPPHTMCEPVVTVTVDAYTTICPVEPTVSADPTFASTTTTDDCTDMPTMSAEPTYASTTDDCDDEPTSTYTDLPPYTSPTSTMTDCDDEANSTTSYNTDITAPVSTTTSTPQTTVTDPVTPPVTTTAPVLQVTAAAGRHEAGVWGLLAGLVFALL